LNWTREQVRAYLRSGNIHTPILGRLPRAKQTLLKPLAKSVSPR
jgi:hypothetical protein